MDESLYFLTLPIRVAVRVGFSPWHRRSKSVNPRGAELVKNRRSCTDTPQSSLELSHHAPAEGVETPDQRGNCIYVTLSHTKFFKSRFAEANSSTNLPAYPFYY